MGGTAAVVQWPGRNDGPVLPGTDAVHDRMQRSYAAVATGDGSSLGLFRLPRELDLSHWWSFLVGMDDPLCHLQGTQYPEASKAELPVRKGQGVCRRRRVSSHPTDSFRHECLHSAHREMVSPLAHQGLGRAPEGNRAV